MTQAQIIPPADLPVPFRRRRAITRTVTKTVEVVDEIDAPQPEAPIMQFQNETELPASRVCRQGAMVGMVLISAACVTGALIALVSGVFPITALLAVGAIGSGYVYWELASYAA